MDRKSERLKYVITAPGLVIIALLLGFLSIFVGVRMLAAEARVPCVPCVADAVDRIDFSLAQQATSSKRVSCIVCALV